jgi:thiol-disulfide isomerase/thioredoxin
MMSFYPLVKRSLFLGLLCSIMVMSTAISKPEKSVVVFTASWCASCRDVVPVVQEVCSQNGLSVNVLDVDSQNAPSTASAYGLSIPGGDLPQAFLVSGKSSQLLIDSHGAGYGRREAIRATVLQNLQRALAGV